MTRCLVCDKELKQFDDKDPCLRLRCVDHGNEAQQIICLQARIHVLESQVKGETHKNSELSRLLEKSHYDVGILMGALSHIGDTIESSCMKCHRNMYMFPTCPETSCHIHMIKTTILNTKLELNQPPVESRSFKVGDRVRIVDDDSSNWNRVGVIEETATSTAAVLLDGDMFALSWFKTQLALE